MSLAERRSHKFEGDEFQLCIHLIVMMYGMQNELLTLDDSEAQ